jgi:hypothetical protein
MVPNKKSKKWFAVLILYFLVVFVSMILSRIIVGTQITVNVVISMVILSLISAVVPSVAGFMGRHIFYSIFTSINLLALVYLFYIVITDRSPGWSDLTSIISYLMVVAIGFVVAVVIDLIFLIRSRKQDSTKLE